MGLQCNRCWCDIEELLCPECAAATGRSANTSTNIGSPKCEQCEHYDISQGVYTVECYSCKRYCGDLFTLRAGA